MPDLRAGRALQRIERAMALPGPCSSRTMLASAIRQLLGLPPREALGSFSHGEAMKLITIGAGGLVLPRDVS